MESPAWNQADIELITSGRTTVSRCSRPREARVFLANKILAESNRLRLGDLNLTTISGMKYKIKQALRARQVFGNRIFGWSVAKLNQQCQQFLREEAQRMNCCRTVTLHTNQFEKTATTAGFWSEIRALAKQLQSVNATLLLQGSHADHTTTSFSDIDLVLFGNRENAEHHRCVSELNRIILAEDPLQHHGVFFYDTSIQLCYSESVLPIATFEKATAIAETVEFKFQILNDAYTPAVTLWSFVQVLKSFLDERLLVRGMWDWKFRVSQFLLIPTLLAATLGKYIYKGDSFRFATTMFSETAWQAIEELTRVRQQWVSVFAADPVDLRSYAQSSSRIVGCLDLDPLKVPDSIASWKKESFLAQARKFLEETLELAGLC